MTVETKVFLEKLEKMGAELSVETKFDSVKLLAEGVKIASGDFDSRYCELEWKGSSLEIFYNNYYLEFDRSGQWVYFTLETYGGDVRIGTDLNGGSLEDVIKD